MKLVMVFLPVLVFLYGCHGVAFEKAYYERISGIQFPPKYETLETFDNGETFTTTSFKVDSATLRDFSVKYHFDSVKYPFYLFYMGNSCLQGPVPGFDTKDSLLYVSGQSKTNTWLYVIDMKRECFGLRSCIPIGREIVHRVPLNKKGMKLFMPLSCKEVEF